MNSILKTSPLRVVHCRPFQPHLLFVSLTCTAGNAKLHQHDINALPQDPLDRPTATLIFLPEQCTIKSYF